VDGAVLRTWCSVGEIEVFCKPPQTVPALNDEEHAVEKLMSTILTKSILSLIVKLYQKQIERKMLFQKKAILLVSAILAAQFHCAYADLGNGLRGRLTVANNGKKTGNKDESKYNTACTGSV
jgi:hypothetical protein